MTPSQLLGYLGPAWAAALLATLVCATVLRLCGRRLGTRRGLTVMLALFFLALTQHPFPAFDQLDCSKGGVTPILRPFATLDHVSRLWAWTQNNPSIFPSKWLGNRVLQAAGMNFFLCAAIGAAFARHVSTVRPWLQATLLAAGLSFGAELTQLTGFWGLYPCPYRTFEVDDLILNISGLLTGFGLWRLWQNARGRGRPRADHKAQGGAKSCP